MAIARQRLGTPRVRGHRYVGGRLGQQDRERNYIAGIIAAVAAQNEREQDRRILAAQRARAAASGLDPNEGASLLAEMESASTAELNARRIRWSSEHQQAGYQSEAVLQGFYAGAARRTGYL